MKNLSIETIKKMVEENFANDFAKMVELNNEFYKNDNGNAIEALINVKENVTCKMVSLLLDNENDNEYWENVEFIEMTLGNMVEEKTDEF